MAALVRSRIAQRRRLSCRISIVGLLLVVGLLPLDGASVRADQDVTYDGAGDAPQISLIGDSTLTGVRWYADYGALERFNFVLSAESCRRTIEQSCISREGYRSANVLTAMRTIGDDLGEVLVVMSGYNDPLWTIDEAIEGVVDEARTRGVDHVVWLTLRTSQDVDYSDPQEQTSTNTFREYNDQLVAAAADSDGYLQVADWATYSNGASGWFESDGVHLTPTGVDALTTYIAGVVDQVIAGSDVSPAAAPWTVLVPGAEGDVVADVQSALLDAGIELDGGADGVYGNDTMAAVAEFQQRAGDLQVTGAVDVATARSLGVYEESGDEAEATPPASAATVADTVAAVVDEAIGESGQPPVDRVDRRWVLVAVVLGLLALTAAIVGRRRQVVVRRRARRWARVHPATSPHRSVADLRRSGEVPAQRTPDASERRSPRDRIETADR